MTEQSKKLARQLYRDDVSRADEVPVQRDGRKAYEGWVQASSDAGDRDTLEALEAADPDAFAAEWSQLAAIVHEACSDAALDAGNVQIRPPAPCVIAHHAV